MIRDCTRALGEARVWLAPGSSLLHLPYSTRFEVKMHPEVKSWLSFAQEKLVELDELRRIYEGDEAPLLANRALREAKRNSPLRRQPTVRDRLAKIEPADLARKSSFEERRIAQKALLKLPPLPTTTIGSFPHSDELRALRTAVRENRVSQVEYDAFVEEEIARVIRWQDELGLDVLVHGEFERSDMVEYFGQRLHGFAITENGWVQSHGSLCLRPPIIYGDVARTEPMTLRWTKYAQSLSQKPVKGMLTGPMTILKWSFVREDISLCDTAFQLALAIRDEVADLEAAGIKVIQIDEPALREALPLKARQREDYLLWSIDAFRLASSGVADTTQIHTHMCYCEFDDILPAISRLDADVLSFESSRSGMARLPAFVSFRYPNEVGPGVQDVHSTRVSSKEEIKALVIKALEIIPAERMWVNPDCGFKHMDWLDVDEALHNMVEAVKELRKTLAEGP
jgi:5-methyltetrahydropteroyltriglutamate--homocysteine methyltransferase